MVIARKLLTPTLAFFALVFLAVTIFFTVSASQSLVVEEERFLQSLEQALEQEIERMSDVSLALAKQMANSPEVRSALFERDHERLKALSQASYARIKGEYSIIEHQFTLAPAQVFLNMDAPEADGKDLSQLRLTLVAANTQQRDISTVELVETGLWMHGISAMQGEATDGNVVKGSVEYSIPIDRRMFNQLRAKYGGDWQVLLSASAMEKSGLDLTGSTSAGPQPELRLQSTTLAEPVFASAGAYDQALRGKTTLERVRTGASTYAFLTMPLRDFRGQVVAVVDIVWDRTEAMEQMRNRMLMAISGGIVGLLLGSMLLARIMNRTLQPVKALTIAAQAIAGGDLRHPLPPVRRQGRVIDEVEDLTRSFHSMSQQLRQLVANLEKMVSERTRGLEQRTNQLQTASEIAREVTTLSEVDSLLVQAVNLIRMRFDFYHAGVFLIEESGETAVLRAATGEAGQKMLAAGHRLKVGNVGLVGAACASGEPRAAADVEQDAMHYKNPLLPETRSEIAVPLRAGTKIVGALDVQSREPNAFDEGSVTVLQIIADQLAIAVNNAQLIQELNRTVSELEEAHGRMTREAWQAAVRNRPGGYRYTPGDEAQPAAAGAEAWLESGGLHALNAGGAPDIAREAIRTGKTVVAAGEDGGQVVATPIRLRGRPIGAMHLRFDAPAAGGQAASLMEDVSNRIGLLLESARLLEEAQRLAQREQQINVIASQMRSSVNLDTILQNTVRELGKALGARRAFIQLGEPDGSPEAGSPPAEGRSSL
jgi:GAF domain-containing protein